jgi:AmmeMemoRadiSam system protein B
MQAREPAVAGLFYPGEAATLGAAIDRYLEAARTERVENLRALICPHAGYEYSGPIAVV